MKKADSLSNAVTVAYVNSASCNAMIILSVQDYAMTFDSLGSRHVAMGADQSRVQDDQRYVAGWSSTPTRSRVSLVPPSFVPAAADFNYFASRGLTTIRIPFLWERLQPTLNGALDAMYLGYIASAIGYARAADLNVILEMDNYGARDISGTQYQISTITQ